MRAALALALVVGCASPARGTLWFGEPRAGALYEMDVASRDEHVIDRGGTFAGLAVEPTSRQLAYTTGDGRGVYVAARDGTITQMLPGGGDVGTLPHWHPGGWLAYTTTSNGVNDVAIAHPPDQPHLLGSPGPYVFALDGSFVAYVRNGSLFVAAPDGSSEQQLATGVPSGITLSPDGGSVLVTVPPGELQAISLADGSVSDLGTGAVRSTPSYDADHVLINDPTGLAVMSLGDGTRTYVVTGTAPYAGLPAIFTPSGHVIYGLVTDHSATDAPVYTTDVYEFDGAASTLLLSTDGFCTPELVSHDGRYAVIACPDPYVATLATAATVSLPVDGVLGFEADDTAVIATAPNADYGPSLSDVVRVGLDGKSREWLTTASSVLYLP